MTLPESLTGPSHLQCCCTKSKVLQTQLRTVHRAQIDHCHFFLQARCLGLVSPKHTAIASSVPINALAPFLKCPLEVSPYSTPEFHYTSAIKRSLPGQGELAFLQTHNPWEHHNVPYYLKHVVVKLCISSRGSHAAYFL